MSAFTGSGNKVTLQSIKDIVGGAKIGPEKQLQKSISLHLLGKAINVQSTGTAPEGFDNGNIHYKKEQVTHESN